MCLCLCCLCPAPPTLSLSAPLFAKCSQPTPPVPITIPITIPTAGPTCNPLDLILTLVSPPSPCPYYPPPTTSLSHSIVRSLLSIALSFPHITKHSNDIIISNVPICTPIPPHTALRSSLIAHGCDHLALTTGHLLASYIRLPIKNTCCIRSVAASPSLTRCLLTGACSRLPLLACS